MPNPSITKFINALKANGLPCFTTDNQVIAGRVTLTASPNIDADFIDTFRLDMPADSQANEMALSLIFFASVWDENVAAKLFSERHDIEHTEIIGDWRLRAFVDDGHPVFVAEAMIA